MDLIAIGVAAANSGSGGGTNGKDGFSPTVNVTEIDGGHEVNITDKNGTKSFEVMDGDTPVKGTDYWTESDKKEIIDEAIDELKETQPTFVELTEEDILEKVGLSDEELEGLSAVISDSETRTDKTWSSSKIGEEVNKVTSDVLSVNKKVEDLKAQGVQQTPLFAESVEWLNENGDTSKVYVLPDGYIYGYMSVTEKNYTNLADTKSDDWLTDYRLSSSSVPKEDAGWCVSNYIPCKIDDIVRIRPIQAPISSSNIQMVDASKNHLGTVSVSQDTTHYIYDANDGLLTATAGRYTPSYGTADQNNTAYIRFSFVIPDGFTAGDVVITVNEEIKDVTTTKWANTGILFNSSDYEPRINALETKTDEIQTEIENLKSFGVDGNATKNTIIRSVNHRGFNSIAPENTLPAYKLSRENGFLYVECDVSITKDGKFVLLHDATVDRTSNGTGSITEMTFDEVRILDFGSWKSENYSGTVIPTLEEFLILCRNVGLKAYLEIKNGTWTQEVVNECVKIVKKCGMLRNVTWIQFNGEALQYVANADSKARLGRVSSSISAEKIESLATLKNVDNEVFLSLPNIDNTVDETLITQCIENDIGLEVWDVNTESGIIALHSYVSGATTDMLNAGDVLYTHAMAD